MKARSAPRSWDGLWPARARRHPTSPTTLTTRPRRTATRPSTVVSKRTQRWEDRSMGQTGIRGPRPLDGEVIMRVGGGKKHGCYYIGDGLVDTASTPTLSQIRARSTANSPVIRPRLSASQLQVQELQVISYIFIVLSFCTYICFAL